MYPALALIGLIAALLLLRWWQLDRVGPAPPKEPFDGDVYRLGAAAVVVREVPDPEVSVVFMPGFLEDFRYCVDYYDRPRVQFIGVVSGDYHLPIDNPRYADADWARAPSALVGTIRHDAEVLCRALEHLPRGRRVRVHGHSRGGAVTVEASRLRPDLFKGVEAVLEAPVLPGGTVYSPLPSLLRWMLPLLVPLWRLRPVNRTNLAVWGRLDDPRKRQLMEALPFGPRRISTMLRNLADMDAWMADRGDDTLAALRRGAILVPDTDRVLTPSAMAASASRAAGLQLTPVEDCSHFVRFDQPQAIPPMLKREPATPAAGSRARGAGRR